MTVDTRTIPPQKETEITLMGAEQRAGLITAATDPSVEAVHSQRAQEDNYTQTN